MGLFKKTVEPSLHEVHAAAEGLASQALSVFHSVAADLEAAAAQQDHVSETANAEADKLAQLAAEAKAAAEAKRRQAQAVAALVG